MYCSTKGSSESRVNQISVDYDYFPIEMAICGYPWVASIFRHCINILSKFACPTKPPRFAQLVPDLMEWPPAIRVFTCPLSIPTGTPTNKQHYPRYPKLLVNTTVMYKLCPILQHSQSRGSAASPHMPHCKRGHTAGVQGLDKRGQGVCVKTLNAGATG